MMFLFTVNSSMTTIVNARVESQFDTAVRTRQPGVHGDGIRSFYFSFSFYFIL